MRFCDHCGLPVGAHGVAGRAVDDGATNGAQAPDAADRPAARYCCYGCRLLAETASDDGEAPDDAATREHQALLVRAVAGGVMAAFVMALSLAISTGYGFATLAELGHDVSTAHWVVLLAAVPALVLLGGPVARAAWADLRRGTLSLNVLFALGTTSAVVVSAVSYVRGSGPVYLETAVMLLAIYTAGRYLTARAKGTATRVVQRLLAVPDAPVQRLAPDPGEVPLDALRPGDRVRIPAGRVLPVDGRIVEGRSFVDASSLTGEARPAARTPGDTVYAGTTVLDGALVLEVTAVAEERRLARIEAAVREALARPPRLAQRLDRLMRWLIPGVVALALATFAGWYAVAGFEKALYAGLSVVLITCPCALGLAIPLTLVVALGQAARRGILVRSGRALLDLARVETVVFDKTGTLSTLAQHTVHVFTLDRAVAAGTPEADAGTPEEDAGTSEQEALAWAAAVEQGTQHALAQALREAAADRGLALPPVRDVRTVAGVGVIGTVETPGGPATIGVGSEALLEAVGATTTTALSEARAVLEQQGRTPLFVTRDGAVTALLSVTEHLPVGAIRAMRALEAEGLRLHVLTGDNAAAAERAQKRLTVPVTGSCSPEQKAALVRHLRHHLGALAMVGDGLNDAAALAEADVGLARTEGAGLTLDAADVALYHPDARSVPWLVRLSRRTDRIVRQNLAWTFGYNGIGVALAVAGLLHPVAAVAIMAVSSGLVTANALRLRHAPEVEAMA